MSGSADAPGRGRGLVGALASSLRLRGAEGSPLAAASFAGRGTSPPQPQGFALPGELARWREKPWTRPGRGSTLSSHPLTVHSSDAVTPPAPARGREASAGQRPADEPPRAALQTLRLPAAEPGAPAPPETPGHSQYASEAVPPAGSAPPSTSAAWDGWETPRSWATSQATSFPQGEELEAMTLEEVQLMAVQAADLQRRASEALKLARARLAAARHEGAASAGRRRRAPWPALLALLVATAQALACWLAAALGAALSLPPALAGAAADAAAEGGRALAAAAGALDGVVSGVLGSGGGCALGQ